MPANDQASALERETQDLLRQRVVRAMRGAADANDAPINAEALAFVSQPDFFFVNAPAAGLEVLDFKPMFEGRATLAGTPVMHWYLSYGPVGARTMPIPEGFYAVVADEQRGVISLRDGQGRTAALGNLEIALGPPSSPAMAATQQVSGALDSAKVDLVPPHVKICGHVTVNVRGTSVTISGCIDAGF